MDPNIFEAPISKLFLADGVYTCEKSDSLRSVLDHLQEHNIGSCVVVDDGVAVGIFTERDFLQKVKLESPGAETPITEYMVHKPVTVRADITIKEALVFMRVGNFRSLIVNQQNGEFQGVVTMKDLMYYITDVAGFQNE